MYIEAIPSHGPGEDNPQWDWCCECPWEGQPARLLYEVHFALKQCYECGGFIVLCKEHLNRLIDDFAKERIPDAEV